MKIVGIDEKVYEWKYYLYKKERDSSSKLHKRARELIKRMHPFAQIFEEVPLIGVDSKLYIDIYVHTQMLALEVQGEQHYNYSPFFFKTQQEYGRAINRDRVKQEWCDINNIDLVTLPYNEKDEQWEMRIRNR